jgi:hypothetical protein
MIIDPKQIAKMITEDPNEVNPLDDTRDRFDVEGEDECNECFELFQADRSGAVCEECEAHYCESCEVLETFDEYDSYFDSDTNRSVLMGCPNCSHNTSR